MCLSVLGRVTAIEGDDVASQAIVDLGGSPRRISLAMVEGVKVGSWVSVHSGYALSVVPESEALEVLGMVDQMTEE